MTQFEPILAPVYPSIGFEDLGNLLRKNGYEIEPIARKPWPGYRTLTEPRFTIELTSPFSKRPGEYGLIHMWTRIHLPPPVLADVIQRMQTRSTFAHLLVDHRGNLVVTYQVVVIGGVTAHYLRDQVWYWRKNLERVHETVRAALAAASGQILH
jgi:hypothetical protein